MSSHVRAFIIHKMIDIDCIEEALKTLGKTYTRTSNHIIIDQNIEINVTQQGAKLIYQSGYSPERLDINKFVFELTQAYERSLQEKIERLRLEEAKMKEQNVLSQFSEEERIRKENEIRKEKMRLEAIKRKEEADLKKQIEQKVSALKEKAASLGYEVKEEVRGKERIMVMVRR